MDEIAIIILVLGGVCWMLAAHPFLTYPLSLLLIRAKSATPSRSNLQAFALPTIAICTCAYNEVRVIESKIFNLLELKERYPSLELLLYIDGSNDGTAEIASRYARDIEIVLATDRHGKSHGMNRLVEKARSELIVFTDANVLLDAESLGNLVPHFFDSQVGCVCGNLVYTNGAETVTAATGSLYWRLEQWIKRRESRTSSVMGADGSIFAIRRALHHPPPDDIIDDMYISFKILCTGYGVVQVADVCAYEESVVSAPEEFRRKVRIACQAFNVHRLMWKELRERLTFGQMYMYVSHKLMRWFSIYLIAAGALMSLLGLALLHKTILSAALLFLAVLCISVGSVWDVPVISPIVGILAALTGAGLGVLRSLAGDRFQTWQPAASIRR